MMINRRSDTKEQAQDEERNSSRHSVKTRKAVSLLRLTLGLAVVLVISTVCGAEAQLYGNGPSSPGENADEDLQVNKRTKGLCNFSLGVFDGLKRQRQKQRGDCYHQSRP